MEKILLTGATGHFGRTVLDTLLRNGVKAATIYAMVRDKAKSAELKKLGINVLYGDYANFESMVKAFTGIDKLFFVSGGDLKQRSEQHKQVVKAAKRAGIGHIFYTSQLHKSDDRASPIHFILKSHLATEIAIMKSGIDYTILRNGLYIDMLPAFLGKNVLENGIFLPAGQGRIAFALRSEIAEATANLMISAGHRNKIYEMSANAVSFTEIAACISQLTGKNITYLSPDLGTFNTTLAKQGTPKLLVKMLGGFAAAAQQGELQGTNAQLGKILGRKPTSVADFLKEMFP